MKYLFNSIFLASLLIVAFLLFNCEESTIKYRTLPAEKADEGSLFHEENNLNNPSNMQGSILKYEKKGRESGVAITSINKEDTNVIEIAGSVVTYGNYKKPGIALGLIRKSDNGGTEVYLKLYEITPDNNLHNNNKKDSSSKSRFPDRFSAFNSQQTQGNVLKNKLDKATKGYWEDSFSPKYFGSAPSPTLYQVTPSYSKPVLPESKDGIVSYSSMDIATVDPDEDGAEDIIIMSLLTGDGAQHLYTYQVDKLGFFSKLDHYSNNECKNEFSNCKTTSIKITTLNKMGVAVFTVRASTILERSKVKYSQFKIWDSGEIQLQLNYYDKKYPDLNDLFNNNGSKENDVASIDTLSFWESRVHDTRSSTLFEYNVGAFVVVAVYKSGKYQAFVSTPDTIKNDNPIPFFDGSDYNQIGLQSGGKEFSDKLTLSPKSIQLELLQWSHAPDETSSYDKGMPPAFLLSARGDDGKPVFLLHDIQSYYAGLDQCNGLWPAFTDAYALTGSEGYAGVTSIMDQEGFPSQWVSLFGNNGQLKFEDGGMSKNYGCQANYNYPESGCVDEGGSAQYLIVGDSYNINETLNPEIRPLLFADSFLRKSGYLGEIKKDHVVGVFVNPNNTLQVKLLK